MPAKSTSDATRTRDRAARRGFSTRCNVSSPPKKATLTSRHGRRRLPGCQARDVPRRPGRKGPCPERRVGSIGVGPGRVRTTKKSQSLRKTDGRVAVRGQFRRRVQIPTEQRPTPAITAIAIPAVCPEEGQRLPTYIRRYRRAGAASAIASGVRLRS